MSSASAAVPPKVDWTAFEKDFDKWELVADVIDQQIDIMLNFRQSGHPGGSRSKVHMMTALLLGFMNWDIRAPEKRFADRFVMVSGHVTPLVYSTLAVLGEAMRTMYAKTGDRKYFIDPERIVLWEDLKKFRRRHGLPGHCEMAGKTLFVKSNTGPSGHGSPPAAGLAMGLKGAGAEQVRVWAMEGEGGMTTGATHETRNSAFGLGLTNFCYLLDWNDFGIDSHPYSSIVPGVPDEWFAPYHFNVFRAHNGDDWKSVAQGFGEHATADLDGRPSVIWFKNRKGRGYLVYDYKSHGKPHAMNSELYWELRNQFSEKYGIEFTGFGQDAPADADARDEQWTQHVNAAMDALRNNEEVCAWVADRLVELGDAVPEELPTFRLQKQVPASGPRTPFEDPELTDFENYPSKMWAQPGSKKPNRAALATWGAWANSWAKKKWGRPVFLVCSADLAESTNISGFADDFSEELPNYGKYDRVKNPDGTLLPQGITEFANSGLVCGIAAANVSPKPYEYFDGLYGACSTYGSFSYLKYGPMRLFSQTVQDSEIKLGKVLWVAGHSGPETAEDSRTHFGIFATGVTQLFPEGRVLDLHPWEYNEVPVVLAAALKTDVPIIALHLTRPNVTIPDREALGLGHHFGAAKGAYILRDYKPGLPKMGTVFVQGTMSTNNTLAALPELDRRGLNVKLVAATSPQLFALQDEAYRQSVASEADWLDSMCVTNRAARLMYHWQATKVNLEYTMGSDWNDEWLTGGSVDEVLDEAHLSPAHIADGIERFVKDRDKRLARIRRMLDAVDSEHAAG